MMFAGTMEENMVHILGALKPFMSRGYSPRRSTISIPTRTQTSLFNPTCL